MIASLDKLIEEIEKQQAAAAAAAAAGGGGVRSTSPAPDSKMTCLPANWNQPTSPHSSRVRCIRPIGSVRNSSR